MFLICQSNELECLSNFKIKERAKPWLYFHFQSENGGLVKTLIGDRFTTVRLQDNADIRVNRLNLETEDYNKILRETFSISLPQERQLDIEKIMRPLKTEHY